MDQLGNLFDAFYTRFVLRDFFGKIIPGFLLLSTVALCLRSAAELLDDAKTLPVTLWIVILGASWIAGFAVQGLGDRHDPIFHRPEDLDNRLADLREMMFHQVGTDYERWRWERFVVIKEACGNGYLALLVSGVALLVRFAVFTLQEAWRGTPVWGTLRDYLVPALPALVLVIGAIAYLKYMHAVSRDRQNTWVIQALKAHGAEWKQRLQGLQAAGVVTADEVNKLEQSVAKLSQPNS